MISTEVPAGLEEIINDHMSFLGDQYQTPPMFSAKKVDGVPSTNGTKGKTVEREPALFESTNLSLPIGSSSRKFLHGMQ